MKTCLSMVISPVLPVMARMQGSPLQRSRPVTTVIKFSLRITLTTA
jgi:hypothetical protein